VAAGWTGGRSQSRLPVGDQLPVPGAHLERGERVGHLGPRPAELGEAGVPGLGVVGQAKLVVALLAPERGTEETPGLGAVLGKGHSRSVGRNKVETENFSSRNIRIRTGWC
jgi:hypothetical protein